ncbi:hypothetical protein TNIN_147391 [Trichonephila inaurata madagascariensis]|uniref:Uncharacterized protein n=1 Tax=Trichonephila inaurata madagascariensis TaxID=2747483 RepID=A0A8X7CU32_9ARAC|nr:hypothetical protein TNIN_147391 [Trichonephila inaurata madagascariensis]
MSLDNYILYTLDLGIPQDRLNEAESQTCIRSELPFLQIAIVIILTSVSWTSVFYPKNSLSLVEGIWINGFSENLNLLLKLIKMKRRSAPDKMKRILLAESTD